MYVIVGRGHAAADETTRGEPARRVGRHVEYRVLTIEANDAEIGDLLNRAAGDGWVLHTLALYVLVNAGRFGTTSTRWCSLVWERQAD